MLWRPSPENAAEVSTGAQLGKFVAKHVRRIEAGLRFERAGDEGHDKVARWCVREIDFAGLRGDAEFSPTHAGPAETMYGSRYSGPEPTPHYPATPPHEASVHAAIAVAAKAGATFRLSGNNIEISGLELFAQAHPGTVAFLEGHRRAVSGALGGGSDDQPSIDLITQLGVEIDHCTTDETAIAAITEIISDAGDGPIAIDVETAPLPGYDDRPPLRLTPKGRPTKMPPEVEESGRPRPPISPRSVSFGS